MPRADEHGLRAAASRLGGAHRRVDAERPGAVVRGRNDAASVRVAADDERDFPELGLLELLHGGEERVEVDVSEDHGASVRWPSDTNPAQIWHRLVRASPLRWSHGNEGGDTMGTGDGRGGAA